MRDSFQTTDQVGSTTTKKRNTTDSFSESITVIETDNLIFKFSVNAALEAANIKDAFRTIGAYYTALANGDKDIISPYLNGEASLKTIQEFSGDEDAT